MNRRRLIIAMLLCGGLLLVAPRLLQISGAPIGLDCPIAADGLHWVVLRTEGELLSPELTATIGSQNVESAVEAAGGDYEVYWIGQADSEIKPEHREAVAAMQADGPPPRLFAVGPKPRSSYFLDAHPETEADCLGVLANLRSDE